MKHHPAVLLVLATACSSPHGSVGRGWRTVVDTPPEPIASLDILFVVDDSGSMDTDQYALVQTAGDQLFGQIEADLGHLPDLHVGVISTDVGAGPWPISSCEGQGDDGRLDPLGALECPQLDGNFVVDVDDGAGGRTRNYTGTLGDVFSCMARLGTNGCGFEQPLEAMRRALDGSVAENDGFLRDDAMLLVVILTDEDDCSTADTSVFDTTSTSLDDQFGPLHSFRCFDFGVICDPDDPRTIGDKLDCVSREDSAYMFPVAGYVDFLHGLKPDPSMVMVAGIVPPAGPVAVVAGADTGIVELAGVCTPPPAPCSPEEPDCQRMPVGPAVRLHQFMHQFDARYVLEPMCDDAMAAMLSRIARTTAGVMAAETCLVGDAPAPAASCRAFDVLADGSRQAIPPCGGGDATCFAIGVDQDRCGYTATALRAHVDRAAPAPAGSRLQVECLE